MKLNYFLMVILGIFLVGFCSCTLNNEEPVAQASSDEEVSRVVWYDINITTSTFTWARHEVTWQKLIYVNEYDAPGNAEPTLESYDAGAFTGITGPFLYSQNGYTKTWYFIVGRNAIPYNTNKRLRAVLKVGSTEVSESLLSIWLC